ncbi:MAG TPA: Gldg family protein [Treponemataceae bacterium]|nr:Gldg family protein [Treponemataceae bacterium]
MKRLGGGARARRIALIIFVGLALIAALSSRMSFRADLSAGKQYSLSHLSHSAIDSLDSELLITWYRSRDFERMTPAIRYIENFLEEYRVSSKGKISFSIRDPALTGDVKAIEALGIVPRQTRVRNGQGTSITSVYSGLLVEYRGEHRVIPFLLDTKTLEYDLTRIILDLTRASAASAPKASRAVQYVVGNASQGVDYRYLEAWVSYAGFSLEPQTLPLASLDSSKLLLVVGSSDIDTRSASVIDSFLSSGGNAAFFVSGNLIDARTDWKARAKVKDPLLAVLETQGFALSPGILMDVLHHRLTLPTLDNSRYAEVEYPFWVTVPRSGLSPDEPIFSGISKLQFFWPSGIVLAPAGDRARSIVRATSRARAMLEPYDTNPFGKQLALLESTEDAREGTVKAPNSALIAMRNAPGRLLVIGDEYLPSSLVDYTGSDSNLDFAVSCVEWIAGEDELITLKARQAPDSAQAPSAQSDAGAKDEPQAKNANTLKRVRFANLVAIPALILAYLGFCVVRKKRRR